MQQQVSNEASLLRIQTNENLKNPTENPIGNSITIEIGLKTTFI